LKIFTVEEVMIMKTILLAGLICFCALTSGLAAQKVPESDTKLKNPMEWNASMSQDYFWDDTKQKRPEDEVKAEPEWALIFENEVGIYAYDQGGFSYGTGADGNTDRNQMQCFVKTLYTGKEIKKKLQEKFRQDLPKGEKIEYSMMVLRYLLKEKQFQIVETRTYTNRDTCIMTKTGGGEYRDVPEGSFAEAMYEICRDARDTDVGEKQDGQPSGS